VKKENQFHQKESCGKEEIKIKVHFPLHARAGSGALRMKSTFYNFPSGSQEVLEVLCIILPSCQVKRKLQPQHALPIGLWVSFSRICRHFLMLWVSPKTKWRNMSRDAPRTTSTVFADCVSKRLCDSYKTWDALVSMQR
jgi:hypothetical protein